MRFTIRDLLWLMVVVGMAVGWWMERRNSNHHKNKSSEVMGMNRGMYETMVKMNKAANEAGFEFVDDLRSFDDGCRLVPIHK